MKLRTLFAASAMFTTLALPMAASALEVNLTPELPSVDVMHGGKKVTIMRNQDPGNTISADFAMTSRKCPPFCIQPGEVAVGVDTIGELEILQYLKKRSDGDESIIVVDSRTPDWVAKGTIPGSVNVPWDQLNIGHSDPITVQDILENQFGVRNQDGFYLFDQAKTVVMFCNGPWCGQSPTNIRGLLKIGYPASKIKWYRGGMQDWEALGLTTVKPVK
jgi:rhodanese-related sulfurtransferase